MADPTLYDFAEAAAEALSGTIEPKTGIKHQAYDADGNSSPSAFAQLMNLERKLMLLAGQGNRGQVVWSGSGLTVGAFALEYQLAGTAYSFAGDAGYSLSLPANETSYVYLDTDETLKSQTDNWPSGDHIKLAKVTTNATQVTGITDMRFANHLVGITNAWWTVAPTANVDFNEQDADNIGGLGLSDPKTLTLDVDGAITLTDEQTNIRIDTYNMSVLDSLDSITTSASMQGRLVILRASNQARTVIVKASAVSSPDGDFVMDDIDKLMLLIGDDGGNFTELSRNHWQIGQLSVNLDVNTKALGNIGKMNLYGSELAIVSGAITKMHSFHTVDTENDAASDDLATISGGSDRDLLWLVPENIARVVTVEDDKGNILLAYSDFVMDDTASAILLRYDGGLSKWVELKRSIVTIADLAYGDPPRALPYDWEVELAGALSVGVAKYEKHCLMPFTLRQIAGLAKVAPSGGPCITDILKNGDSIFASQSEMVNIPDGETGDKSVVKDADYVVDDVLGIEVEAANGAEDLTLSFHAVIAPQIPP